MHHAFFWSKPQKNKDFVAKIRKKAEMEHVSTQAKEAVFSNEIETVRSSDPMESTV